MDVELIVISVELRSLSQKTQEIHRRVSSILSAIAKS